MLQGCAPSVKLQMSIVINIHEEISPNFTYILVLSTQLTSTPNLVKISSLLTEIWPVAIFDQPVPLGRPVSDYEYNKMILTQKTSASCKNWLQNELSV